MISPMVSVNIDVPEDHSGPYMIVEIANLMLVKSDKHYEDFARALAAFSTYYARQGGRYRLIREADLRAYNNAANTNYRGWWVDNQFVGPDNWRDATAFPYLYR